MDRRGFLTGLLSTFAAPAIVRANALMPLRGVVMREPGVWYVCTMAGMSAVDPIWATDGFVPFGKSPANPFPTMWQAMKAAGPGDTIYVANSHVETVEINEFSRKGGHLYIRDSIIDAVRPLSL
jgi:hypothetical protein